VELDPAARQVWCQGQLAELSTREYDLLHVFVLNAGRVLTRDQLEQYLYSWGSEVASNTIEVHIYHLRRKLHPKVIETVRGVGYVMHRNPA
jgi:two-component system OmpR family response regulator/two-component system response regulator QseB